MSFYSNLRATASRLLETYGQKITFSRTVKGVYDSGTAKRVGDSETTFKAYGAVFDYKTSQFNGSDILVGDVRLVLQSTSKTPIVGDRATVGGKKYSVMNVEITSPGGEPVVAECQLRVGDHSIVR